MLMSIKYIDNDKDTHNSGTILIIVIRTSYGTGSISPSSKHVS